MELHMKPSSVSQRVFLVKGSKRTALILTRWWRSVEHPVALKASSWPGGSHLSRLFRPGHGIYCENQEAGHGEEEEEEEEEEKQAQESAPQGIPEGALEAVPEAVPDRPAAFRPAPLETDHDDEEREEKKEAKEEEENEEEANEEAID